MDDVNPNQPTQPQAESEPAEQPSEAAEQTADTPDETPDVKAQERMVPLTVLQEERKKRQEYQRQLAERESANAYSQYDPEDLNQILQHPMVQELILKDAKRELTDFARETMDQYPHLNPQVKKAILANVRGFVHESTSDIETGKMDLLEYIEDVAAEVEAERVPTPTKSFKVASTNVPASQSQVRPADVEAILQKPIDSWTEEDAAIVDAFSKKTQQ